MEARDVKFVMPAATEYSLDRVMTPLDGRIEKALVGTQGSHLRLDPCLSLAAAEYGRHIAPGEDGDLHLPKELQSAVLHHAGCTDGWVASHLFFSSSKDETDFFEHFRNVLEKSGESTHVGVGRAKARAPYRWAYVVFLAERSAIFKPIPRALSPGETLQIEGKLLSGLKDPRVLLLEPGGEVVNLDVEERRGSFSSKAQVGRVVGEHWVELLADGVLGPRVVALFPVYVGEATPTGVRLEPPPDESMIVAEADAEKLMFKLLNTDRARFGIQALEWSDPLSKIAGRHSRDMRDNGFFAHISPKNGELEDRFLVAQFPARALAENISRNNSVYDAQEGLMLSLGHRENILSPNFTHVGIGVVFDKDEYGRRTMFFTQNFATPQRNLTGKGFQREVLRAMRKSREARRLPVIHNDKDLQEVAAIHARLVDPAHGGQPTAKVSEMIKLSLTQRRYDYKAFYIQTHTVLDPKDVQLPDAIRQAQVTRVGIGAFPFKKPGGATLWKTLIILTEH